MAVEFHARMGFGILADRQKFFSSCRAILINARQAAMHRPLPPVL
jgi:hypothetical protein